ncbi:MAG: FtsZ/tubulin family protein [Thermoplasmataceae archaeon]
MLKGIDKVATGDEIVQNLKAIVAEYFEDRFDNTVISFGNAGSRVLRNVTPFEVGKTNFHAVKLEVPETRQGRKERAGKKSMKVSKTGYFRVELAETSGKGKPISTNLTGNPTPFKINEIHVSHDQFASSPELLASQIFNNMPRSSSFILVSGFGGEFAQAMHIAFSTILKKRKIAHINVVIKPSAVEEDKRRIADRGIIALARTSGQVKVYDNEEMVSREKLFTSFDTMNEYEKVNQVISRNLHFYSMALSETAGVIRKSFLEE